MESVEFQIEKKIKAKGKGTLFFPDDFSKLGSSESIRKALQRLEEKEIIRRIAQGIYTRPIESKYIGEVLPSAEEVAKGIAKRDRIRIVPTGVYALNALGLSTQVPMNVVCLTDGAARKIDLGKRKILFKKTAPKNLAAIGTISSLTIQALKVIGKDNLKDNEKQIILKHLSNEDPYRLEHDIRLAPEWIRVIMRQAIKTSNNE